MASVKRRGAGWQATYRGPDGRERTKTFARKVDAENWAADERSKMARGAWIDPRAGRVTLQAFAAEWLAQRDDLRPTTAAKYRYLLDRHVLPRLGSTTLARLTPTQVRAWNRSLSQEHASTAAGAYRLLSTICRAAVVDKVIAESPCRLEGAASEKATERPTITLAELDLAAEATDDRFRLALLLAAWCQLRRGEILALRRRQVDELRGTLKIDETWTSTTAGELILGPPKTDAGRRTVTVPGNVLPALLEHLRRHVDPEPDAWLFAGEAGRPCSPRTLDRHWTKARTIAGREDLHFHDLRHSGLTWAAATGATAKELMRRGGHASPAAALRYQHATDDRDRVLADALADLAGRAAVVSIVPARAAASGHAADIPRTRASSGSAAEPENAS